MPTAPQRCKGSSLQYAGEAGANLRDLSRLCHYFGRSNLAGIFSPWVRDLLKETACMHSWGQAGPTHALLSLCYQALAKAGPAALAPQCVRAAWEEWSGLGTNPQRPHGRRSATASFMREPRQPAGQAHRGAVIIKELDWEAAHSRASGDSWDCGGLASAPRGSHVLSLPPGHCAGIIARRSAQKTLRCCRGGKINADCSLPLLPVGAEDGEGVDWAGGARAARRQAAVCGALSLRCAGGAGSHLFHSGRGPGLLPNEGEERCPSPPCQIRAARPPPSRLHAAPPLACSVQLCVSRR
ncbi:hypothetical protein SKAU_G00310900 [Synaphobranchus kaupii]|uniref:Uncharacterized protein n=1 Tax=Synaphobranchus kaupii TaxID=118154 RepID=A0A9Q1ERL4_SYNKA|nr:hypothetical protein SKAU_G00310900 [Synaphobranchus kaupii]